MRFFKWRKKKDFKNIYSLQSGKIIDIESIEDSIFSKKILGDGIGIIPNNNQIYSPVDGEIVLIANTKHAIGIKTYDGLKILIHLGIDTVELKGEGFKIFVELGDKVKHGDILAEMDLGIFKEKNFNPIAIMIIENMEEIEEIKKSKGNIKTKNNVSIKYKLKRE